MSFFLDYISERQNRELQKGVPILTHVKRIIPVLLALAVLLGSVVYADFEGLDRLGEVSTPEFTISGNTVTCKAKVRFPGQEINATLELYRGNTLVAWWTDSGTGSVTFSEPAPFISGMTYTLTISGTANGIAFTPQSTTQTLW